VSFECSRFVMKNQPGRSWCLGLNAVGQLVLEHIWVGVAPVPHCRERTVIPCLMHVGIKHDRGATNLHLLGHPGFEILRMMHRSNAERTVMEGGLYRVICMTHDAMPP